MSKTQRRKTQEEGVKAGDEVWAIHPVDLSHLAEVKMDMTRLGVPTIHVARNRNGFWVALEGCHRIRAAHDLGLCVSWVPIDRDARLAIGEDADIVQLTWQTKMFIEHTIKPDAMNRYNAGELVDSLITPNSVTFTVAADGALVMLGDHDAIFDDEAFDL